MFTYLLTKLNSNREQSVQFLISTAPASISVIVLFSTEWTYISLVHADVEMCLGTLRRLVDVTNNQSDVDRWRFEAIGSGHLQYKLRQS